ncbi:MAG: PAS domain S-box protein [Dehalococcoidia bacterium]|jgi:PAS domain S-box-containing protein
MKPEKLLKDRYFWYVAAMALIAGLSCYAPQLTGLVDFPIQTDWQVEYYTAIYRLMFPISALIAAWRFGVKGGLVVCFIIGPVILSSVFINSQLPNALLDIGDVAVGFIFSWLVGKQGEMKQRLEQTTAELRRQSTILRDEIAERRKAKEQYRLVAEYSADVIYKLRIADECYIYVSPSVKRLLGYTEKEALTMKPKDVLTPESYEKQFLTLLKDIESDTSYRTLQLEAVHKDGHTVPIEVNGSLVRDENGVPAEIVGVARDITERKKMEEQLIIQDRLASIGQLSAGMAHEINNPITGIVTFSALLLEKDLPEDIKNDLKTINGEAERTAGIVKNLLTFARKQPQEKHPTNINDGIRKILNLRAYEHKVSNIRVDVRLDPDLPEIYGDASQLEQVFFNIVINAEFFMLEAHGKGVLTITTEKTRDFVRSSFADDGPGISRDNMNRLFDPFFTTKAVGKGTGLGLSICHGIITEHEGRIWAESEPDEGTIFFIELPVHDEQTSGR